MQSKYIRYLLVVTVMGSLSGQEKELTFEKLESLVKQKNPELIALSKEIKASEGSLLQKSLRLNPEFEIESGSGIDPETVVQLNQTFELGGKRLKRTKVGELEVEKTRLEYRVRQLEILKEAKSAFIDVLINQKIIKLIEDKIVISNEFLSTVKKKVTIGRLSPAEESRAKVLLAFDEIELSRSRRTLKNDWKVLASFWGSELPQFDTAIWNLDSIGAVPYEESLDELVEKSPVMTQRTLDIRIQESVINLERANRIPDLTMGAGFKRVDIPGNTYQLDVSIPLPLFDRNQGAIMEANAWFEQARDTKRAVYINLKTEVKTAYSELEITFNEIELVKSIILPEAEQAYQIINEGYLQGKFDYLDVVDSQNTLFEAKENLLVALSDYHKASAELESLLGQPLNSIKKSMEE